MLGSKVLLLSAAIALTLSHVTATGQATTHIKVHKVAIHKKTPAKDVSPKDLCIEGWTPMSVEGVDGLFCTYGEACVAHIDGSCPEPQYGLEYGAYCDEVQTGVMGCKPLTEEMWWEALGHDGTGGVCGEGASPMSVEGVEGVFCVEGQACVADIDGACPGPQDGLTYGAYCGTVASGVKGCKPNPSKLMAKHHKVVKAVKKH